MKATSTDDPGFLSQVRTIFENATDVLVVVRYAYGAGSQDFLVLADFKSFHDLVSGCRKRDSIVVMKHFEKIAECTVDRQTITEVANKFHNGEHWILIGEDNYEYTANWSHAESIDELLEELNARLGRKVYVVEEPNYVSGQASVGAYVPDEDGIVRPGVY